MVNESAGLVMYIFVNGELKFFIVRPGGPFWKDKDEGVWSIPKGEIEDGEDSLTCAKREFEEETGISIGVKDFISLGSIIRESDPERFMSKKIIHAWGFEGNWSGSLKHFMIDIEWPLGSGNFIKIPEIDKAGFYGAEDAKKKLEPSQIGFIDRLVENFDK